MYICNFFPERDDGVHGVQRDCVKLPDNVSADECVEGELGDLHGTICYCKSDDCNKGDVSTTTKKHTTKTTPKPPGDKLKCYRCLSDANCFYDGQSDGTLVECEAPENTGCFKASIGMW